MTGIALIARLGRWPRQQRWVAARRAQAVAAAALTAGAVVFTLTYAAPDDRVAAAIVNGLLVGVPMAVALLSLGVDPDDRFSRVLVVAGALFSLTVLSESPVSLLYSLGRLAAWLAVPVTLYLLLAFPSGRLVHARDRMVLAALGADAILFLATTLVAEFPLPAPWTTCSDCPANAFALADWGVVHDVVRPVREVLLALIALAVALSLARRVRRAGQLLRSVLEPALAIAAFLAVVLAVYEVARAISSDEEALELLGWLNVLCLPAVAIAFGAGLLRRRLRVAAI